MTPHELEAFERAIARIMLAPDPVAALERARVEAQSWPEVAQIALRGVDEDGLRVSALLIAKLRFERLLRGCPEAEGWFDQDPADFTLAFQRYHREQLPTALSPAEESRLFLRWCTEHMNDD